MPTVTSLTLQRNKKRVNVYVDNEFCFGIDMDNLLRFGIKIDKEFSQEQLEKIIFEAEFQKTLDKITRFGMVRPRSQKEYFDWLKRKKVPESLNERLFEKLKKLSLLNDIAFSKWWTEQRLSFKKKSPRMIRLELLQKGVDPEMIENVLSEKNIDERVLAEELLLKKAKKWERYRGEERGKKMSEFLLRSGFSWEIVKEVVKKHAVLVQ